MDDGVTEDGVTEDGRAWLSARVGLLDEVRERMQVLLRERDAGRFETGLADLRYDMERLAGVARRVSPAVERMREGKRRKALERQSREYAA